MHPKSVIRIRVIATVTRLTSIDAARRRKESWRSWRTPPTTS